MIDNEVQPKQRPWGMLTGAPPRDTATPTALGAGQNRRHPLRACHPVLLLTFVIELVTSAAPSSS